MKCECGKTALYVWASVGYCSEHRANAIKAATVHADRAYARFKGRQFSRLARVGPNMASGGGTVKAADRSSLRAFKYPIKLRDRQQREQAV